MRSNTDARGDVKAIAVDIPGKQVHVEFDESLTNIGELSAIPEAEGYPVGMVAR